MEGPGKRDFLNRHQIDDGSKNAQYLYLWTEKGAWLHAKSLNTDEAWNAYETLVDEYYRIKENNTLPAELMNDPIINLRMKQIEQDKRLTQSAQ